MVDKASTLQIVAARLQAGALDEALEILAVLAADHPNDPDVLHYWGSALLSCGDVMGAADRLSEAHATAPDRADIANDLGVIFHRASRLEEADVALREATRLEPDNAQFHHNLGYLLADRGDVPGAEAAYRTTITLEPQHASAWNNLGNIQKGRRDVAAAAESYSASIAADESFAPAYKNLADLREWEGDWQQARALYATCATHRDDAGATVRSAMALPIIAENVAEIDEVRSRMADELATLAAAAPSISVPLREVGGTPFLTTYHGRDDRELHTALAAFHLKACPSLAFEAPHCSSWSGSPDKIRIGFVSAFFREHTIAKLNRGLIAHLPRDEFEVEVFSFAETEDAATNAIRQSVDRFTALPANLEIAREAIAAANLDILYYTDIGMDPVTYFLAFARLAPIQCTTWGHPDTTGIPNVDYFVSSDTVETPGADDAFSETLIRLKPFSTYVDWPRAPQPVSKEAFGLSDNVRHYVCPQSLFKFHPEFDDMLGRILRADRRSELLLLQGPYRQWAERLKSRLARTLPDVIDQIRFLPRLPSDRYLDLLAVADVVLDTPHFCGGMTTYEALAAGAPVVTLPSGHTRGRLSLGLYRQMGVDDLVASDADDYVAIAQRLGSEPHFNLEMRQRIVGAVPALFDNREAVDAHARFFKWAAGNPTDPPPIF